MKKKRLYYFSYRLKMNIFWLYNGFRLFASRICQRKYCIKAVGRITLTLHSDRKSDWTADVDDRFILLIDIQLWDLNDLFLFLCKMNHC